MSKTVVFSIRVSADVANQLSDVAAQHKYWKRNALIEKFLEAIVYACPISEQKKMLHWWRHGGKKIEVSVTEQE